VDPQHSEPHCVFCGRVFPRRRSDRIYCLPKCRARASKHRALAQAARQALTDPAFVRRIATEDARGWLDAADLFRSLLIAQFSTCLDKRDDIP
jgi:hypothetical protein